MGNWFNSAFKAVTDTAGSVGKNISETASGLVNTVQSWLPFSEEDKLAFFAVLFAVAAADGKISEDELSAIFSSPEVEKLSKEGKQKLQSYSCNPPALEDAIAKLSKTSQELKFGLIFYILSLAWVDGVLSPGEAEAIEIARQKLEINTVQIEVIEEFIKVLVKVKNEQSQEASNRVQAATERMKNVGVPIGALIPSQNQPEQMEYSDEQFLEKMKGFGLQAGKGLVEQAFTMWYVIHDPIIPAQYKLIVAGALAYWILPVDMVPDILPAVGFTDDFSIIASALGSIAMSITPDIRLKAQKETEALFTGKPVLEGEIIDVAARN